MEKRTLLAGWLIDGTGAPAAKNVRLTIEAGRIVSIDPAVSTSINAEAVWLDLSGHTLFPPLYDCHTHLTLSGIFDSVCRNTYGSFDNKGLSGLITEHIKDYLRHGVISVRDGGDRDGLILRFRTDCTGLKEIPFELFTPGTAWHREGRYGKFIGMALPEGKDPVPDMESWASKGIDHIKVIQSGMNSLSMFGAQTAPQFGEEDLSRIYALCKSRGIGLMVHANGEKPVGIAVKAGCDSIEHGFFMGDENLQKMADAHITWVPTAVAMKAYAEHSPAGSVESRVARKTLDHQLEQLLSAKRFGVPVALGTDAGSPGVHHGKAVGEELGLLVSAGYSIEEAVRCATANAAALLKSNLTGRIRAGDPATFIAVKGNPSRIPERPLAIDTMMVFGRLMKPDLSGNRPDRKGNKQSPGGSSTGFRCL